MYCRKLPLENILCVVGNALENALRAVGREDVVKKAMYNVEVAEDEIEQAAARAAMDQSGKPLQTLAANQNAHWFTNSGSQAECSSDNYIGICTDFAIKSGPSGDVMKLYPFSSKKHISAGCSHPICDHFSVLHLVT